MRVTRRPEERIQRAVVQWLRAHRVLFTHPQNEQANKIQRQIGKALGVLPGVSDLIIFDPPPMYPDLRGTCLELKAKGRKATAKQQAFLDEMSQRWWATACLDSLDGALDWLRGLGYGGKR